ncbi:MAG: hypothetical protein QF619_04890, partial [Candidatus Binatia bacterium]|nr:hypothetical protein [Candidatus Binatia bacterium]
MESPAAEIKEKILSFFSVRPRRSLSFKEIQKGIRRPARDPDEILDALRELAREGRLVRLRKNHYALPLGQNMITGRIRGHPDGFGFLIPEDGGAEDLYLNRREMCRAMHGDRALVRIEKDRRGGSRARIVQILERGHKRMIGTYEKLERRDYLFPMDPRLGPPLKLARGMPEAKRGSVIAGE